MSDKVLVTGASGFIGSWVVRAISNRYEVIAVESPYRSSNRLNDLKSGHEIAKVDLANRTDVNKVFRKYRPSTVVHLASHGVYGYQQQDEERIVLDNILMVQNLLDASAKFGVKKFINTGSVFEYGTRAGSVKEHEVDITDIINKYSAVKIATTSLASYYKDQFELVTIRPFTAYGPWEDKSRFISGSIGHALLNEEIPVAKNIVRDFIYVQDMAVGYEKALSKKLTSGIVINLGSGQPVRLTEVAKIIKRLSQSKSKITFIESKYGSRESRCWADITVAKKLLNWKPKTTLIKGLQETIDWVRSGNIYLPGE